MAIVTLESATPWYAHFKKCMHWNLFTTNHHQSIASCLPIITCQSHDHGHHDYNHHDQNDRPHLMVRSLSPTHTRADSSPQFVQICHKFLLLCGPTKLSFSQRRHHQISNIPNSLRVWFPQRMGAAKEGCAVIIATPVTGYIWIWTNHYNRDQNIDGVKNPHGSRSWCFVKDTIRSPIEVIEWHWESESMNKVIVDKAVPTSAPISILCAMLTL